MRAAASRCAGRAGFLACPASCLRFYLGEGCDPDVYLPTDQIQWWLSLCRMLRPAERTRVRKAWRRAADSLSALPPTKRWRKATGPLSATICILLEQGWTPTLPVVWGAPTGTETAVLDSKAWAKSSICSRFEELAEARVWAGTLNHWGSEGLGAGPPDFSAAQAAAKLLRSQGLFDLASCVAPIACGGLVTADRAGCEGMMCRWCEKEPDTFMHRFWSACTESRPDDSGFVGKGQPLMHSVCDGSWDE